MRVLKRVAMLALAISMALASLSCASGQTESGVSPDVVESDIFRLMNLERAAEGLSIVTRSETLDALAEEYSQAAFSDAAEETSDIRYLVSCAWSVTYTLGPRLDPDTASEQVAYCVEQPDLRDAIFRPEAREAGVGVAISGDTVYYTQVFDVVSSLGGDGEPVSLYENPEATNPYSWEQLKDFVVADNTDTYEYSTGSFICTDFAETLHNNAELAGIRAAYVSIGFPEGPGHALCGFSIGNQVVYIDVISGDKVAYIEVDKKYGVVALDVAVDFSYVFFESYAQRLLDYLEEREDCNQQVEDYGDGLPPPAPYSTPLEWSSALQDWGDELDAEQEDLGIGDNYFPPYGSLVGVPDPTVVRTYVHW